MKPQRPGALDTPAIRAAASHRTRTGSGLVPVADPLARVLEGAALAVAATDPERAQRIRQLAADLQEEGTR